MESLPDAEEQPQLSVVVLLLSPAARRGGSTGGTHFQVCISLVRFEHAPLSVFSLVSSGFCYK